MARGIVIGKHKGKKVRVRYPSQLAGYITMTFASKAEAKRYIKDLFYVQRNRAVITEVV